jgi:putative tryptophan/tyrosine transport system substrate-binding protein
LRELGYIEGRTVVVEARYADGHAERVPVLAADLVRQNVDVVVASGLPAARALKQITVPVVLAVIGDPLSEGIVKSFAKPGGNITGLAFQNPQLTAKRLGLLKETIPGLARVAALVDSTVNAAAVIAPAEAAARSLGLRLHIVRVAGPDHLPDAFREVKATRAEALVVLASPFISAYRQTVVELAAKQRLPATYEVRWFVEIGGLMSYGPDFLDMYRRAATYVDKILKGAKPADLPVEQAQKFELAINLTTARTLGLTIPPSVFLRADLVIE